MSVKKIKKIFHLIKEIKALFTKKESRLFTSLLLIIFINSLLEMAGIGAISPLISLAVEGSGSDSAAVSTISRLSGFTGGELFYFIGIGFIILTVIKNVFSLYTAYRNARFSITLYTSFSSRLMGNFLSRPYTWFLNRNSSDFPRLIINETNLITRNIIYNFLLIITNMTMALGLLILLGWQNLSVALVMFLFLGGLYFILYVFFKSRLRFLGKKSFRLNKERFTLLNNVFGGIKEVKIREKEVYYLNRFRQTVRELGRSSVRADVYSVAPRYAVETVVFCLFGLLIIFLRSGEGNLASTLPTVSLYAFAGYRLLPTLQKISRSVNSIVSNMESLDKLKGDLAITPHSFGSKGEKLRLNDLLLLKDLSYTYPGGKEKVLDNFSLSVSSCEKIGIVGFSGSGKTTLLNIIMGLLEPQEGFLQVDDTVLNSENLSRWRLNLGLVSQDVYLLDGTVAENIAFGLEPADIDKKRLEEAARAAEIHKTILSLPEGYGTEVGERGVKLSGGQAQRVVIARALYHNPDVLIFDEATSAMDNLTEKAIMDSINRLSGEKTIIIVAHRLTTVKDCDRIILLKDGMILNQGTYDELMEKEPQFRRLTMESDS